MKKYPILQDGEKLVLEDINATSLLAGVADDGVRASTKKIFVEDSERKGWAEPWRDGSLVIPNGSDGTVKVQPFTAYMSPKGATSNAGSESATGGSETTENLKTGRYEGGTMTVATPLPTSGNMRWDLLYATVSESDGDAASRLVATVAGSTKVVAVQTINTRHSTSVTLNWVQGTASPTATDPYPSGSMPVLPTASAGTANVPLAYVQVQYSATPATVQYTKDRIANAVRLARQNPQSGSVVAAAGLAAGRVATSGAFSTNMDVTSIITSASSIGGWPTSGTNIRPVRFIEPMTGGIDIWIPVGPFSTTGGNKTWGSSFVTTIKIASPDATNVLYADKPWNWLNRFFHGTLVLSNSATPAHAWDLTGANAYMPSTLATTGDARVTHGFGNTVRGNSNFDFMLSGGYKLACWFGDVSTGAGDSDDIALVVNSSGDMFLAAREINTNALNGAVGMIHLHVSGQTFPYGL